MLSTGANPTLVAEYLHRQNCPVKPRDVFNMKYRQKFHGTPMEEIMSVLDHPGISYQIDKDEADNLQCVSFCTDDQRALAAVYGGVLLLDGTYRINKFRMPLYTLAIVDSEGHGQPVAHAVVAREDTAHISMFLKCAEQWFPSITQSIFVIDKDFAELNAIKSLFPQSSVHLCRFHVLKAFLEEMKHRQLTNEQDLYQVCVRCEKRTQKWPVLANNFAN